METHQAFHAVFMAFRHRNLASKQQFRSLDSEITQRFQCKGVALTAQAHCLYSGKASSLHCKGKGQKLKGSNGRYQLPDRQRITKRVENAHFRPFLYVLENSRNLRTVFVKNVYHFTSAKVVILSSLRKVAKSLPERTCIVRLSPGRRSK